MDIAVQIIIDSAALGIGSGLLILGIAAGVRLGRDIWSA